MDKRKAYFATDGNWGDAVGLITVWLSEDDILALADMSESEIWDFAVEREFEEKNKDMVDMFGPDPVS